MLDLETPVNDVFRRDRDLADTTLLDPTSSSPVSLEQGEWLTTNSSNKLVRVGASSVTRAWQLWTPRGDFSAQAIGKVTVIQNGDYIALTDMYADAGGGFTLGQYLTVKQITVDGQTRSGLTQAVQGTDYVYGTVEGLPADNGGKLKFRATPPWDWST